jgi:glycosyltransferase involved in cell wall biosynthesis
MATFNGARFLREQLDSLARQTLLPSELVVCDDGSRDESVPILESFSREAPFEVRLLRNELNQGFGETFLRAATAARGDWIAFCDQDDVWLPHKLSRCMEIAVRHPNVVLVCHSAQQVDAELRPLPSRMPDYRRGLSFRTCP